MRVTRFLLCGFFLSEFIGLNYADAEDIAEKILDAKKRMGELEVQHTKLALQLAQEGQNLKQIADNAMLDTQNFITSEKDKEEQLKNAIAKINSLEKQQADLVEQVRKLNKTVSDTKAQQRKLQKQELQRQREPVINEPLVINTDQDVSQPGKTKDTSAKNIKPEIATELEDLDELNHVSIEESNGISNKQAAIKTNTVSQEKPLSEENENDMHQVNDFVDNGSKVGEHSKDIAGDDKALADGVLKDLEENGSKDGERSKDIAGDDKALDDGAVKDLENNASTDDELVKDVAVDDKALDNGVLKDLEEKGSKNGEHSKDVAVDDKALDDGVVKDLENNASTGDKPAKDVSASTEHSDTEKTAVEKAETAPAEDIKQKDTPPAKDEEEVQTSEESTAEANKTIDESEKAVEESEKKVGNVNSSEASLEEA